MTKKRPITTAANSKVVSAVENISLYAAAGEGYTQFNFDNGEKDFKNMPAGSNNAFPAKPKNRPIRKLRK